MPKWGERIVKARKVAVVECSTVDPVKRVIETETTNVGLTNVRKPWKYNRYLKTFQSLLIKIHASRL